MLGVSEHSLLSIALPSAASALTNPDLPLPCAVDRPGIVPITYVPARNIIFLTIAASYAETLGIQDMGLKPPMAHT